MPDPIRAGDPPTPLPSEVLGSVDGGRGIAAFVLRPADLDRLPLLTTYPPDPDGDVHASCRAIQAGEREQHAEAVRRLRRERDEARAEVVRLGQEFYRSPEQRTTPATIEGDPHRPHLDSWPDDAVLLRYRELRALVALHLDRYCDEGSARAMREGDVPLRLAEVLDR